jgi:two-component system KDP operon response regulator KdpE
MSHKPHILVIDDEPQILRALRAILAEKGYDITTASRGEEGLALAAAVQPDIIILDLSLPDIDGTDVCRRLREWTGTPIIILSVREGEQDKVAALDVGADDYLTKPFGIEELLARIRVGMRHLAQAKGSKETVVSAGDVAIDLTRHVVTRAGEEVKLTATEWTLLAYLASNAGRVLTHRNLLEHVWGWGESDNVEYLRVYMRQLRMKLEEDPRHPRFLLTETGIGYRFVAG